MKVEVKKTASKSLAKIDSANHKKIETILLGLQALQEIGDIHHDGKLKGYSDRYKVRTGSYRIIYKVESTNHILITAIAHRKDIYNKLFGVSFSF